MFSLFFASLPGPFRAISAAPRGQCLFWVVSFTVFLAGAPAAKTQIPGNDFADFSMEELMNEAVTSVAKKETPRFTSPAAIAVVSNDDIRRQGIETYPEALRWLPGTHVARINSTQWAVSVRGFNSQLSDKLLVLQDGRTLYTPTFGGIFWDSQDTVMEDLERIEVVRGPGATLWGANAVNGVVNIVTKSAKDTQGTLLSTTVGTENQPMVSVRHGGVAGSNGHYRVYVKHFNRDSWENEGMSAVDHWRSTRAGLRYDLTGLTDQTLTVQGEYYMQEHSEAYPELSFERPFVRMVSNKNEGDGYHARVRWSRREIAGGELAVQLYHDAFRHENNGTDESRRTSDIELQHQVSLLGRHDLVWGAGYRYSRDRILSTPFLQWTPEERRTDLINLFVQDEISLVPERFKLIAGVKLERNDYTGWETQPSVRGLWTPSPRQTFWAGVSRAVRTPTRLDADSRVNASIADTSPTTPPLMLVFFGNPDAASETVLAREFGWRLEASHRLSLDVALFWNDYGHLTMYEMQEPEFVVGPPFPHVMVPHRTTNKAKAESFGAEFAAVWRAAPGWRLSASYSVIDMRIRPSRDEEGDTPRHQANLRSHLDLPGHWELNAAVGYTARLVNSLTNVRIPAYTRVDLGLIWRPRPAWELGVWGRNLTDPGHPEFSQIVSPTVLVDVPREYSARLVWRF